MRVSLVVLLILAVVAPASAGAPRRGGLVVWPARTTITAGNTATLHITNHTHATVSVAIRPMGLALDVRGAPRLVRSSPGTRLVVVGRRRALIAAGRAASVRVSVPAAQGLAAGDRPALILVTARSGGGVGIGVQVRIGVPVEVRVPGAVRRGLALGLLHVRGRLLELAVRNTGNVAERLGRGSVVVEAWRGSRRLATLQPRPRELLPHTRGLVQYRVPRGLHGRLWVVARTVIPGSGRRGFSVAF